MSLIPSIPTVVAPPDLAATMSSIQSGAATSAGLPALASIGAMASSLPSSIAAGLAAAQSAVAAQMAAAKVNMSRDMSIVKANIDLQNKLAASTGQPLPDPNTLLGPLEVLKKGPEMLSAMVSSISASISSAASQFSVTIPSGASATVAATTTGAALSSFSLTIPATTIPNPDGEGTIPNPAYAAFTALPENVTKLAGLSTVSDAVGGHASSMSASMSGFAATGTAALSAAVGGLKAFSLAMKMAAPMVGPLAAAMANGFNMNAVSPLDLAKSLAKAQLAIPPTIDPNNPSLAGIPNVLKNLNSAPVVTTGTKITSSMVAQYRALADTVKADALAKAKLADAVADADAAWMEAKSILTSYANAHPGKNADRTDAENAQYEVYIQAAKKEKARLKTTQEFLDVAAATDNYGIVLTDYYSLKRNFESDQSINSLSSVQKKNLGLS